MSHLYDKIIMQCKYKWKVIFLAEFKRDGEDASFLDGSELFISLKIKIIVTIKDVEEVYIFFSSGITYEKSWT